MEGKGKGKRKEKEKGKEKWKEMGKGMGKGKASNRSSAFWLTSSANGGAQSRWNKNGKEIFYMLLDSKMMAAPVKLSPDGQSLETGTLVALFPVRIADDPLPGPNKQQLET